MKSNLQNIWMHQEADAGRRVVRDEVASVGGFPCYVGLVGTTGARMFQMVINKSVKIHPGYLQKFAGVEIQVLPREDGLHEYTILLLDKDLTDIFALFIEDILNRLNSVEQVEDALLAINQRIRYWRKLLAKLTGELLSSERKRGLFGELYFLRLLLINCTFPGYALGSWQGSQSANQDFIRASVAVEVKTTKANKPAVHISSEYQLDSSTLSS